MTADLSIPNQIARSREVAVARDWPAFKIYVEPKHVSAELWTDKRPALRDLLDDVAAGRVPGVCARHTDRFWRNNEIQGRILAALRARGVELWDFSSRYEYRTAHGRFSLQVLGAASELEVSLCAERIREMKRGKARRGQVGGGPPPYGYTSQSRRIGELTAREVDEDEAYRQACLDFPVGRSWYVDDREAAAVRMIFELYTSPQYRYGARRIAQRLNELGFKTRHGKAWLGNFVCKLINNPVYAGFTTFDEKAYAEKLPSQRPRREQELFPGAHPPLIESATWTAAQTIKAEERATKRPRPARVAREFTLTGLLRCPRCKSRMVGKTAGRDSYRSYYICARRHNGGAALCDCPLVDGAGLQREVWTWLHRVLASPEYVVTHAERLAKRLENDRPKAQQHVDALARRRDEIRAALAKYFALFETSPGSDAAFVERVRQLKGEQDVVERELREAQARLPKPRKITVDQVRGYLDQLRSRLESEPARQRVLLQDFKRRHELRIDAISHTEFVISIALDVSEPPKEGPGGAGPHDAGVGLCSSVADSRLTQAHRVRIEGRLQIAARPTLADWVRAENARGHVCACGCGKPIRVAPQHHSQGIPRYLRAHHLMGIQRVVADIHAAGMLTSSEVARKLGVGLTTLLRYEGVLWDAPPRHGSVGVRGYTREQVKAVKAALRRKRGSR